MKATIYHNPRCSKSRQTYQILDEAGLDIEEIRYLDNPPTVEELDQLCQAMGVEPIEITRTKEALFKALELSKDDVRSRKEWLQILVENPRLIERPIVKIGDQVVMGRPPENVKAILP
ncbi:arsenate reductase (glutaredoxin) [Galenea microaerophila]